MDVIKAKLNQPIYSREHGGTRAGQGGKTEVLDKEERLKTELDRKEKLLGWTRRKDSVKTELDREEKLRSWTSRKD